MQKIEISVLKCVKDTDIIKFVQANSENRWNECCDIIQEELTYLQYKLHNVISEEVEYKLLKLNVKDLQYDCWVKKFTETQGLTEDYLVRID